MSFKNLFAFVAVVFASFIQMGCGNQNPNTLAYNQIGANGLCSNGQYPINGVCMNNTNNNYPSQNSCTSGTSYPGSTYGCQVGYVMQGNMCVCQASITGTTGTTGTNGGCQQGYYFVQGSCYQQGPCYQGYAFVTPTGMCYRVGM